MESGNFSLYRQNPVIDIDLYQTMYHNVFELNKNNLNAYSIGFFGKNITFKELKNNVDRLASIYSNFGIKEGDTVAIATICMPIVQENLLALSKLGATSKWIDLRNKKKDLIKKINESNCEIIVIFEGILPLIQEIIGETNLKKVVVASPKSYLNPVIHLLADLKDQKENKLIRIPDDKRFISYNEFVKINGNNVKEVSFNKDRPSIILQSSGSTGEPKTIIHTEYNFNSAMRKESYSDLPFAKGRAMHVSVPPFIIYGLNNSIYAALVFGMKAEMSPYVNESTVFDDLGKFDFACATPLHYRYIYDRITKLQNDINYLEKQSDNYSKKELIKCLKELNLIMKKLSRVQIFVSGGDTIAAQEQLNMEHTFGKTIINGYGNNELTGAAIISPVYASKLNSVGIPMKDITVRSFDPDTMQELKVKEEGELCVLTDNAFVAYLGNEKETKRIKRLHNDGKEWIHTGDLGYVDEDGYVFITGRIERLIKRTAFKIAPEVIEKVILSLKEVSDCVVVGVPDTEEKQVPMAFIKLTSEYSDKENVLLDSIKKICGDELPDYEIPKYFVIVKDIPYKNGKHAFLELEEKGKEYVKKIK